MDSCLDASASLHQANINLQGHLPLTLPPCHPPLPSSPEDTYAWLPGSTECVRCAAGVAYAHTANNPPAASEGGAAFAQAV